MLTRCPSCSTTFRITPEQLKARQGRVRCGKCEEVFNALESLVEETQAPAGVAVADPAPTAVEPEPAVAASSPPVDVFTDGAVSPAPTFIADAPEVLPNNIEPVAEVAIAQPSPAAQPKPIPGEPESLVDYEPNFDTLLPDEAPRRVWPWALGAALALLALAAQAIYHYRVEVAVAVPEARPALQEICAAIGCQLPLPRKVDLVAIEASDLHPDPANAAQLQLAATLKNRAPFVQAYPHLELTLTDTSDKALLRRVLEPSDYLPKEKNAASGFAAGSDLAFTLKLEVKDIAPVGYRLYVFYP